MKLNSIIVLVDCVVTYGGLPTQSFTASEVVQPYSPYYYPLLWSGLANDSGEPGEPSGPIVQPMETVYVQRPTEDNVSVKWDNTTKTWTVYAIGSGGGGGGGGTAAATTFSPAGNISATNVQTAIQELDNEKVHKLNTFTSAVGSTLTRVNLNFGLEIQSANLYEVAYMGVLKFWQNEWGAIRGTSPFSWGDALVRGIREDGDTIGGNGQVLELVDRRTGALPSPGNVMWGRKWSDGTLVRNGVLMADTYVRVGGASIPANLPAGTIVVEVD